MKTKNILITTLITLLFWSCLPFGNNDDDIIEQPYPESQYEPIILSRSDFESTTLFLPARSISNSGKIYVKDQYLFVNEVNEGFHVFNNSNPETPENIGFIKVPASTDLSIKNDILYVNNATDLIALRPDFDTETIEITKRIPNVFPDALRWSPDGFYYYDLTDDQVIIGWELIE